MMHDDHIGSSRNDLIAPGTALVFSLLMIWLGPSYQRWFGDAMPAFTRHFLDFYPFWIGVSTAALVVAAVGAQFPLATRWPMLWRSLDGALTVASILVIACGVIALFLPLLLRPMPG
jgi:hypothetical protein